MGLFTRVGYNSVLFCTFNVEHWIKQCKALKKEKALLLFWMYLQRAKMDLNSGLLLNKE
jgi:hypothetical protein